LVWQPEYLRGVSRLVRATNAADNRTDNTDPNHSAENLILTGNTPRSDVALGGVRLIGACLEIEYLGNVEDA
jgi:hypothetical protein